MSRIRYDLCIAPLLLERAQAIAPAFAEADTRSSKPVHPNLAISSSTRDIGPGWPAEEFLRHKLRGGRERLDDGANGLIKPRRNRTLSNRAEQDRAELSAHASASAEPDRTEPNASVVQMADQAMTKANAIEQIRTKPNRIEQDQTELSALASASAELDRTGPNRTEQNRTALTVLVSASAERGRTDPNAPNAQSGVCRPCERRETGSVVSVGPGGSWS